MKEVKKNSIQNEVYKVLKEGIMTLQLVPGTAMSTQEMADKLNVSRTPVREAFIRLHEASLVYIIPQRETIVSRIDMTRAAQERFIRESLELSVLDLFFENCTDRVIAEMRECIREQRRCQREKRYADLILFDDRMHRILFMESGMKLAWETLQSVNGHDFRYRVLAVQDEDIMKGIITQHEEIVSLIERGDKRKVKKVLSNHFGKVKYEKSRLQERYPEYFLTDENKAGLRIGEL